MSSDIFIKNSSLFKWIQITAIDNSDAPSHYHFFEGNRINRRLHGEVVQCIVAGVSRDCVPHSTTTVGYSTAISQNLEMFKQNSKWQNFLQRERLTEILTEAGKVRYIAEIEDFSC